MPSNKRGIAALRDRIREIADEENIDELHDIADEMYRNTAVRRARNHSKTMTPALAQEIRDYARKHQNMHQRDIAQKFNVNPGRVSEAMNNIT